MKSMKRIPKQRCRTLDNGLTLTATHCIGMWYVSLQGDNTPWRIIAEFYHKKSSFYHVATRLYNDRLITIGTVRDVEKYLTKIVKGEVIV